MVLVMVVAVGGFLAACVTLITLYVQSDYDPDSCADTESGLLAIEPPPFLDREACADNYFFVAYVSYDPATPQAPYLLLIEYIAGTSSDLAVRNPVQWAETLWGNEPAFAATFECDGLVVEAKAGWREPIPVGSTYVATQLQGLAQALDRSCAAFNFTPLPTREPRR